MTQFVTVISRDSASDRIRVMLLNTLHIFGIGVNRTEDGKFDYVNIVIVDPLKAPHQNYEVMKIYHAKDARNLLLSRAFEFNVVYFNSLKFMYPGSLLDEQEKHNED